MTANKISIIFLLLVLSTLASSQELADPFSTRNLDEGLINCNGKIAVCVGPITYKYCIMDTNGQWIASGITLKCRKNMRCVNDGVEICVPLKTSTEVPLTQVASDATSSVAVPSPSTGSPILTSSSIMSSSTSSSILTDKSNSYALDTETRVEATRVAVETTPTPIEVTNAPVQTTVIPDQPQVNTVATTAGPELLPAEETTTLPRNQNAPMETTEEPVNFYDITTTENAELNFNIITTIAPAEQSNLVDTTEPNNSTDVVAPNIPADLNSNPGYSTSSQAYLSVAQTSESPDVITPALTETSALPFEPVYTSDNPVLSGVNSGMPLVPIAPVSTNVSADIVVEAISTAVDSSPRETTLNPPSDPTLLADRTTVPVDQTSPIPTVYSSEPAPTVSADQNIPEEQSLPSTDPASLDGLNVTPIPKSLTTSSHEPTSHNLPVDSNSLPSSATYPQVIINERDITNISSGAIPDDVKPNVLDTIEHKNLTNNSLPVTPALDPSTQANTVSPLDFTNEPLSTSTASSSQQTNPKIPLDSSVHVGTEITGSLDYNAKVDTTLLIPQKAVLTANESHSQPESSASVTSSPLNIITTANPDIIAVSKAPIDLNALDNSNSMSKANELESSSASIIETNPSSAPVTPSASLSSQGNINIASEADKPLGPKTAAKPDDNQETPLTTNIEINSSTTAVQNNKVAINIPNASSTIVTSINPVTSTAPTTPTQSISPAHQLITEQSMLENTDILGDASVSLNANASANSNAAVNTQAPVNPNTVNSSSLTSTSADAIVSNSAVSSNVPTEPSAVPSVSDIRSNESSPILPLDPNASVSPDANPNVVANSDLPHTTDMVINASATAIQDGEVAVNIPNVNSTLALVDPNIAVSSSLPSEPNGVPNTSEIPSVVSDPSVLLVQNVSESAGVNPNAKDNSNAPPAINIAIDSGATAVQNNKVELNIPNASGALGTSVNPVASADPTTEAQLSPPAHISANDSMLKNTNIPDDIKSSLNPNALANAAVNANTPVNPNTVNSGSAKSTSVSVVANNSVTSSVPSTTTSIPRKSDIPSIVSNPSASLGPDALVSTGVNPNSADDSNVPLTTDIAISSSASVVQHNNVAVNVPNASSTLVDPNIAVSSKPNAAPSSSNTPDIVSDPSVPLGPNASVSADINPNATADHDFALGTNIAIDSNETAVQKNKVAVNTPNASSTLDTKVNSVAAADSNTAAKPNSSTKPLANPGALENLNIPRVSISLNPSALVSSITSVNINAPVNPNAANSGSSASTSAVGTTNNSAVTSSVPSEPIANLSTLDIPLNPNAQRTPSATANSDALLSSQLAINSKETSGQKILIGSSTKGAPNIVEIHSSTINPISAADANTATQAAADVTTLGDPNIASGVVIILNPNASVSSNAAVSINEPGNLNAVNSSSSGVLSSKVDLVLSGYPNELLTPSVSVVIIKANTTIKSSGSVPNVANKPCPPVSNSCDSNTPIVPILPTRGPSTTNSNVAHDSNKSKNPDSVETDSTESKEKPDSNENSSKEDESKEETNNKKNEKKKKKEEEKKKKEEEKKKKKQEEKKRKEARKKLRKEEKKNKKEDKDNSGSDEDSNEEAFKEQKEEKKKFIKRIMKIIKKGECDEDDIYPDVRDCKKYYRCIEKYDNTQFVHMHCEDDKLYDFEEEQCVNENQAQCLLKEE